MDITAAQGGSVTVEIKDSNGVIRGTFSLSTISPDDTLDGLTESGAAGTWSIMVTVTDFFGDGSLHVGSED